MNLSSTGTGSQKLGVGKEKNRGFGDPKSS